MRRNCALGLLLFAATFLAYWPAMRGGFVWDDELYVLNNPILKARDGLRRIWCTTEFTDYYALSNSSFWFEWRLWGARAAGYHVTNVLLHALNALLLWRLLTKLEIRGAYVAALVFALHPVNVMSVAWISERKNLLSVLFALLSMSAFVEWGKTKNPSRYVLSLAAFALALLSKTAVVMLPCVLVLLLWWQRGRLTRRDATELAPFFVLSIVMGLVTIWFERQHGIAREIVRTDSLPARLAGAGWAVWFYLGKIVWPAKLAVIYPRWQIDAGSVLAWLPLSALVVCFVLLRKHRGAMFALAAFVIMLFPVLGFFDIAFMAYSFVADHWEYPALAAILAGLCAVQWTRPLIAVLGVGLAVLTWQRANVWRDAETLWRDAVRKNPGAWMAHNNLANALHARGRDAEAMEHYRETIRLQPNYGNAHFNLGVVSFGRGDFVQAAEQFDAAQRLKPQSAEAHNNFGAALVNTGRTNDALVQFEIAAQLAPQWPEPRANLARLRRGVVDLPEAKEY